MALRLWPVAILFWFLLGMALFAQPGSLVRLEDGTRPFFARDAKPSTRSGSASLFSGANQGFFMPVARQPAPQPEARRPAGKGPLARLRDLIAKAEAGQHGYDAVQHGAQVRPQKPPTQMTLAEIFAWIEATPGQPHAIGRYQFIPKTLAGLVKQAGIPRSARFSPVLQDRLANMLMNQAGLQDFLSGETGHIAFMNALARVWAGLPNSSGQSHYHGYAGNKASITWAFYKAEMLRIFPDT